MKEYFWGLCDYSGTHKLEVVLRDSECGKCCDPQLERRHEQMKRNLEAQYKELEEKRRVYEDEKANWEAQQRILEQQKLDASKSVTHTHCSSLFTLEILK